MPLLLLIALFITVPLAELYLILKVGDAIGAPLTILLLAADSLLGSVLLRSQGRIVWKRFNEALAQGRMPHREVQDGVAVIFGGAFLITPGFLTDIVGLALLVPPTRAVILKIAARRIAKRMTAHITVAETRPRHEWSAPDSASVQKSGPDVEGTATEPPPAESPRLER